MIARAKCSVCGGEYPVKKDGNLWKHEGLNEETCSGVPLEQELDVEVLDKGSDYQATPHEAQRTFTTYIDVKNPANMVHSKDWQNNQKRIVVLKMEKQGIVPDGPVQCTSIETISPKYTRVTYEVPHK